jgi:hypothetical protein
MAQDQLPIDDNLHLILSSDQELWLNGQISGIRQLMRSYAVALLICIGWFVSLAVYAYVSTPDEICAIVPQETTLQQLKNEGLIERHVKECDELATTLTTISSFEKPNPFLETLSDIALPVISIIALIIILTSIVDLIGNTVKLRRFKRYKVDHQAFLEKYNRLPTARRGKLQIAPIPSDPAPQTIAATVVSSGNDTAPD